MRGNNNDHNIVCMYSMLALSCSDREGFVSSGNNGYEFACRASACDSGVIAAVASVRSSGE